MLSEIAEAYGLNQDGFKMVDNTTEYKSNGLSFEEIMAQENAREDYKSSLLRGEKFEYEFVETSDQKHSRLSAQALAEIQEESDWVNRQEARWS